MSDFYNNSIFWVEVDRISPNPYQPRREFDDQKIASLADSIRQYGVLQPLTVTRKETQRPDGGIAVEYELIAGERRLRAAKLAGVPQVPVTIRAQEETDKMKLELAIIENLQREDLNPIDRAKAFKQLVDEFNLKHIEVAKKVGKSREYVSNTLRLLGLPELMQQALAVGAISEGHARPLLMLGDRPEERDTLFKEITEKKLTVRESERIARRIATDKARKQDLPPELIGMEKKLSEELGTRVQIEQRAQGGKVHIDYFSEEDLERLLTLLAEQKHTATAMAGAAAVSGAAAVQAFNDTYQTQEPAPRRYEPPAPEPIAPTMGTEPKNPFMSLSQTVRVPSEPELDDDFDPFVAIDAAPLPPLPPLPTAESMPSPMTPAGSAPAAAFDPFADLPPIPPSPHSSRGERAETDAAPATISGGSVEYTDDAFDDVDAGDTDDDDLYSVKNFVL